jgi:serine/threonine-protein kinase
VNVVESIERCLPRGYAITERLGEGATSWVFLAEREAQETEGEPLVVKVLRPTSARLDVSDRFLREIKLLRQLEHPHIVSIRESGEAEGALYFTMPYLGRMTLRTLLAERGVLSVREALEVARDLADALGHAHTHGVVHRDIKPENVLVTESGALLMDFGFADVPSLFEGDSNTAVGTPDYVSPEQVLGKRGGDWRSDYFSLGCVLFEMLTGRTPYAAESSRATMRLRVEQPAPNVRSLNPAVPDDVAAIVRRSLERSPNDRYPTSLHLRGAIRGALERLDEAPALVEDRCTA